MPRPLAREHRLLGVDHQVEQHLLQLMRIGEDLRQPRRERVDDGDVRDALLVGAQRQRFAHHLVQVHHRARALPLARERQELAHDLRRAFGFVEDDVDAAPRAVVERLLRQPLRPGEDRRQRVVELVRDAGDRLAERGHLLGLQQLLVEVARLVVQLLSLADVAHQRLEAQRRVRCRAARRARSARASRACRRRAATAGGIRSRRRPTPGARKNASRLCASSKRPGSNGRTSASGVSGRVAEHELQMRVGGEGVAGGGPTRPT